MPESEPVAVDVVTATLIDRAPADVAAYACNPDNATAWYANIASVAWQTPPPLAVGSRLTFVAQFLGRRLEYTYEVRERVAGARVVMSTAEGHFPMETTYTFAPAPGGRTTMTLRNRGNPSGFAKVAAPLMARAMRKANRADLARIKALMERPELSGD
jgi:uncharacterized membrane protein